VVVFYGRKGNKRKEVKKVIIRKNEKKYNGRVKMV
jgi:hypothetical protein